MTNTPRARYDDQIDSKLPIENLEANQPMRARPRVLKVIALSVMLIGAVTLGFDAKRGTAANDNRAIAAEQKLSVAGQQQAMNGVSVQNSQDGKLTKTLSGHTNTVASGNSGETIKLWNISYVSLRAGTARISKIGQVELLNRTSFNAENQTKQTAGKVTLLLERQQRSLLLQIGVNLLSRLLC